MIDKIIGSFYESSKERNKIVVDIADHIESNTLFAAV